MNNKYIVSNLNHYACILDREREIGKILNYVKILFFPFQIPLPILFVFGQSFGCLQKLRVFFDFLTNLKAVCLSLRRVSPV